MKKYISLLITICLFLFSCQQRATKDKTENKIQYTVANDSVTYHYNKGWQQIMDEGNYATAEVSYRKALKLDPDFLIGKSILARLTTNLEERISLYNELEQHKASIKGDERLVLDVYIALTRFTNIREQEPEKAEATLADVFVLAEKNLRKIVHKYPDEVYLKSEYIEILHAVHGAKKALDSVEVLASAKQKENPFILGYTAIMEADLGHYKTAVEKAQLLKNIINDSSIPKPDAVLADVYFKMDSLKKAKKHADRAFELDPRNLDASRLKSRIDQKLDSLKTQEVF
ncbi:hypothetical protein GTQ40_02100 [Flavobacteriaceae bacterium R38]|nr:hypothetical protein [Flavobacteriaceae bacterium R38]